MTKWEDILKLNQRIPHGIDEKKEEHELNGYCIQFQSINVFVNDHVKQKINASSCSCRLQAFFFDSFHQRFFGRSWTGPTVSAQVEGDYLKAKFQEQVFFLTPTVPNEEAVWLLVEIVARSDDDSEFSCGWAQVRPFQPSLYRQLPDLRKNKSQQQSPTEAKVHAGSVRCFISMKEENISSCKQLGSLTHHLYRHPGLQTCADPFPEDALIGRGEPVPGLVPGPDSLRKAQLAPKETLVFEKIVINIAPSILTFEEELKRFLLEDLRSVDASCKSVEIVERRLKVGVHNGWEYVDCEVSIGLALGQSSSSSNGDDSARPPTTHRRSMSMGKMQKMLEKGVLVAKNPVQVEVPHDPLMSVLFVLEYLVSEQAPMAGTPKAQQLVSVRYAAFSRDTNNNVGDGFDFSNGRLRLEMSGGPDELFPDAKMLYKQTVRMRANPNAPQFKVTIKANCHSAEMAQQQQQQQQQQRPVSSNLHLGNLTAPGPDHDELVPSARTHSSSYYGNGQLSSTRRGDDEPPAGSVPLQQHNQSMLMSNPMMLLSQLMLQSTQMSSQRFPAGEATDEGQLLSSTAGPLLAPSSTSLQRHLNTTVCTLSRTEFARLAASGFPAVVDEFGESPEIVDDNRRLNFNLQLELKDSLVCNELVLQFLAFTVGRAVRPKSVFFSFQLYRFPSFTSERLQLSDSSFTDDGRSFVLHRSVGHGVSAHGYEARFGVDPTLLRPGELQQFVQYLHNHVLHIDIFDGDSLLFLGSCGMSLRPLLRQGRRAVQTSLILGVVQPQEEESASAAETVDWPAQVHVKVANLGARPDPRRSVTLGASSDTNGDLNSSRRLVEPSSATSTATTINGDAGMRRTARAKVVRVHQSELPKDLRSQLPNGEAAQEAERQRRLARLRAVKAANPHLVGEDPAMLSLRAQQQERRLGERQLHTIDFVRERSKDGVIQDLLESSISMHHTIYTSFGSTEFFELAFDNPANTEQEVTVEVMDEERKLQILIDQSLVLALKSHFGVSTPTDQQLFAKNSDTNTGQLAAIWVRPKERVLIPFRYFETSAIEQKLPATTQPSSGRGGERQQLGDRGVGGVSGDGRPVKVYLRAVASGSVLSVLNLRVNRQPAAVDQTLRFYQSENTFFKRSIRLPGLGQPPDGRVAQPTLICSDGAAVCHVKQPQSADDPIDVFVKLPCSESPKMQQLLLAVYTDPFQIQPQLVTQLLVQSLQQVDIACSLGQPATRSLLIRGFSNSRRLRCFASHPDEVRVEPQDAFLLPATTSREISVGVQPQSMGKASYRVSLVDVDSHQLLKCWLYNVTCDLPELIRTLDLSLALGSGRHCNRKFNYTNEYGVAKRFIISCNRPDLLQFAPAELHLQAKATGTIRLHFVPQAQPCTASVFFFVYDDNGNNEETVLFRLAYSANAR